MNAMERRYVRCNARLARAKDRHAAVEEALHLSNGFTVCRMYKRALRTRTLLVAAEKAARSTAHALCFPVAQEGGRK